MDKKRKVTYLVIFSAITLIFLVLCLIRAQDPGAYLRFDHDLPAYGELLEPRGHSVQIAYEIQATPLIKAGVAQTYRSDFVSTVIIAVDRDQIKDNITGWASLAHGDYQIYFPPIGRMDTIHFAYPLLAIAAGVDRNHGGFKNTIHLLKKLQHDGRLVGDDLSESPVRIMFDHQVALLAKGGRNIEIIVPKEGTLSFPGGVMALNSFELPKVKREELLDAGFRLPTGEANLAIYPDPSAYLSAHNATMNNKIALQVIVASTSFSRQVLGERRFAPVHRMENVPLYTAFIIATVLWSSLLYMRVTGKALQIRLFAISALLVFWMVVRITKLFVPVGVFERLFWYLYYVPLTFVPALLFSIGLISTRIEQDRFSRQFNTINFLIATVLTLLVLTNDLHEMAFRFYKGTEGRNYDLYYTHGWVYYAVFAWSLISIFAFVLITTRKTEKSSTKQTTPLLLLLCGAVLYFGGYARGIPILRASEFSIVYGIISLLFLEISLRKRLIPNNILLGELLHNAPIDMYILSDDLQIQHQTTRALKLPKEVIEQTRLRTAQIVTPFGFSLPSDESVFYGVYKINGGYTISARNLNEVIHLRSTLAEQNRKLETQNGILTHTHSITNQVTRLKTQRELFTRINLVLKEQVSRLNKEVNMLSENPTKSNKATLQKQLGKIATLVNYCKRRSHLTLCEASNECCDVSSLALWLQESLWEASATGIEGLVTEAGTGKIPCTRASLIYDSFEHILQKLLDSPNAVVLTNLSMTDTDLTLRVGIETTPRLESDHFRFEQILSNKLAAWNASYQIDEEDDRLVIQISVPKGGQGHA